MPHAKSYIGNDTVDDDMVAVIDNPHSMPSHTSLHREKSSKSNSHSNIDNNDNKNENIGNNRIHHRFGAKDFTLVYDKEWSAARINGGFSFIE